MVDFRRIQMRYDADARTWLAESDDLPGLVTEAPAVLPKLGAHGRVVVTEFRYKGF